MSRAHEKGHYRELPKGSQGDITLETHLQSIKEGLEACQGIMAKTEATLLAKMKTASPEAKAGLKKLLRDLRRSPLAKGTR